MAINISFVSDVGDLLRGTDQVAKSMEDISTELRDVADEMDDTGRATEKATEKIEDGFKDAGKGVEKFEDKVRDAMRKAADSADDSGKKMGKSQEDGLHRASEGMDEFKDEANSTAREAAASFDGSAESIGDVFQELAANAFAGFGPAGAVAGIAAAIGLGIAITKLQDMAEVNTEAKEAMAELGREIYDTGGKLDEADIAAKVADIAFALGQEDVWFKWGDQAKTNVGMVKEALDGVSDAIAKDAFKGLAGDMEAAARAQGELSASMEKDTQALSDHILMVDDYGNVIYTKEGDAIKASLKARKELSKEIEEQTGVHQGANDEVDYYTQVMGESTEATEAAEEATRAASDALRDHVSALDEAAGAAQSAMSAEISWEETLDSTEAAIRKRGKATDNDTEKGRENNKALLEIAKSGWAVVESQVAQGDSSQTVTKSAQSARKEFLAAADAAGYNAKEAAALADAYGLVPGNVKTMVEAEGTEKAKGDIESIPESKDTEVTTTETGADAAQEKIDGISGTEATVEVTDAGSTAAVQGDVDALAGNDVPIKVDDKGSAAQVQGLIDGIKGRDVGINLRIDNAGAFAAELDRLTAKRSLSVTVNQRRGTSVTP